MKESKTAIAAIGAALMLALTATPAIAAIPSGGFLVKASLINDASISGKAGLLTPKAGGTTPGGGTTNPSDGGATDNSAIVRTLSCGSKTFNITQSMIDWSEKNMAAIGAGDMAAIENHPTYGFAVIDSGLSNTGGPESATFLGFSLETGETWPVVDYAKNSSSSTSDCKLLDRTAAPADKKLFGAALDNIGQETVYYYEYLEGKYSEVSINSDGYQRSDIGGQVGGFRSDSYPAVHLKNWGSVEKYQFNFTDAHPTYTTLTISEEYSGDTTYAIRYKGAGQDTVVTTNSAGTISGVQDPENRWDGVLPQKSNYNFSAPFVRN